MSDPVRRLGIGSRDPAPGDLAPRLAAIQDWIVPTASEWALLTSVALIAVPLGLVAWFLFGIVAAGAFVVGQIAVLAVVASRARHRHRQQLRDDLPVALDALARDLRTGASFRSAVARQASERGPMARYFRRVHVAIELGQAADDACAAFVTSSSGAREHQTVVGVLAMVSGGGRGSARALEEAARAARQEQGVRGEVRALVAQAESSVRVLAALPVAFVGLGMLSGQDGATALIDTSIGRWCLVVGVALDGIGLVWMRRLVRSVAT